MTRAAQSIASNSHIWYRYVSEAVNLLLLPSPLLGASALGRPRSPSGRPFVALEVCCVLRKRGIRAFMNERSKCVVDLELAAQRLWTPGSAQRAWLRAFLAHTAPARSRRWARWIIVSFANLSLFRSWWGSQQQRSRRVQRRHFTFTQVLRRVSYTGACQIRLWSRF